MADLENLSTYFKPEERHRGEDLIAAVLLTSTSDTDVRALIKASPAARVEMHAEDVAAAEFRANCNCKTAAKGTFCKHIWAVLRQLQDQELDFLEGKSEMNLAALDSPANLARQAAKAKQSAFQKSRATEHRERQKQKRRDLKDAERGRTFTYPAPVEEARVYFAEQGFPMEHPLELDTLNHARKILSRVFHPDKGGSQDEALALQMNYDLIREYLRG